ncbi:MAG: 16S rRNA (cytosine(1402)-N(4))-methyltransferase RsmH [Ruminococcaceae bacterium]|nr:16S rRNA (cytosine(1402)-N(4))-methyltransferase RsmH [Oscillospiraceae bacterium]
MEFSHISVLLEETLDALDIKPDGIYVDCTCGGAGHSSEILKRLSAKGRLIAIDQDPDAIAIIKERIGGDGRVTVVHDNFSNLRKILDSLGIDRVDGVLADLGVSSHQLDTAERGFSFHNEAPLDMRMSQEGMTAADIVNTFSQRELTQIFRDYGEEKFAQRIAASIVAYREREEIKTTTVLAEIVKQAIPAATRRTGGHPARRVFQALRIRTNLELDRISETVGDMFDALNVGGRVAIITFHSLEDRIVKKAFASYCKGCECPPGCPVCVCGKTPEGSLPFKKVLPSEREIEENQRSRSATLRCVERIREKE